MTFNKSKKKALPVGETEEKLLKQRDQLDVTERKKAEVIVRENEQLMQSLFESVRDGISVLKPDLTIRHVNEVMKKWYKENLPLEGKKCYEVYHNADKPCAPCPSLRCSESGNTEWNVVPGLPGSPVEWIELYSYPIINTDSGKITGIVEFVRDITQRTRAEEALRESEIRFRILYNNSPDMYVSVSPDDAIILLCNATLLKNTGYSREEVIGFPIFKMYHDDCMAEMKKTFKQFLRTGKIKDKELSLKRKDGSKIEVSLNANAVRDETGKVLYSISSWRDISAQKQAEAELAEYYQRLEELVKERTKELEEKSKRIERTQQALSFLMEDVNEYRSELTIVNQDLKEANQELEAFTYSVSHDLRAPLRAIDGFSLKLNNKYHDVLDEEGRRLINIVRDSTGHMAQLIDDLLALSRLGKTPLTSNKIDMIRLCKDVKQELVGLSPDRTIKIKIDSLPPAKGDRNLIKQVLINLVSNAIKFTKFESSAIIKIGCKSQGNENIYYVKDNGVGFDMKYVGKLFQVFQRLHSDEDFEGTGAGLAIVHRIIHRHGGKVWAEAEVGKGATICFSFRKKGK